MNAAFCSPCTDKKYTLSVHINNESDFLDDKEKSSQSGTCSKDDAKLQVSPRSSSSEIFSISSGGSSMMCLPCGNDRVRKTDTESIMPSSIEQLDYVSNTPMIGILEEALDIPFSELSGNQHIGEGSPLRSCLPCSEDLSDEVAFPSVDSSCWTWENISSLVSVLSRKPTKGKKKRRKRPHSDYNLFFYLERALILQRTSMAYPTEKHQGTSTEGNIYNENQEGNQVPIPARYKHLHLPRYWYLPAAKTKRRHRKTHGAIGFVELSRMISSRWKTIDSEVKDFCGAMAEKGREVMRAEWQLCGQEVSNDFGDKTENSEAFSVLFKKSSDPNYSEEAFQKRCFI